MNKKNVHILIFHGSLQQDNKYKLSDIKVKPGRYKFVCSHCGKVFEEGYAIKVKGSKCKWDLVNKNSVATSADVSNGIELTYNKHTHIHTSSDKLVLIYQ